MEYIRNVKFRKNKTKDKIFESLKASFTFRIMLGEIKNNQDMNVINGSARFFNIYSEDKKRNIS